MPVILGAAVTRRAVGDLMLVDCAASPFLGHRDGGVIGGDADSGHENVLGFQFVFKGVELVREGVQLAREFCL